MSSNVRTSNQSRASTKIVLGFLAILALGYGAKLAYEYVSIGTKTYPPLGPGVVNLVGVDTKAGGYRIVVANGIAQLVESQDEATGSPDDAASQDDSSQKKRVPVKELLLAVQNKSEAVGRLVAVLNDMRDEDLPASRVYWSKANLERALAGDEKFVRDLERDLNTKLDGTPLAEFRPANFQRGIVLELPVTLKVPSQAGPKDVTGTLLYPYQTRIMRALEQRVKDVANLNSTQLAGYYAEIAKGYLGGSTRKENVAEALRQITSEANLNALTELPQKVLSSVRVIINESMITQAKYARDEDSQEESFDMDIELSAEGRDRLWRYSRDKVGTQLLLVVDGIAIAAPRIGHQLSETHLTISNLPEERLVRQAVDRINSAKENQ